jgi:hypothetical protein
LITLLNPKGLRRSELLTFRCSTSTNSEAVFGEGSAWCNACCANGSVLLADGLLAGGHPQIRGSDRNGFM